jgi:hypothetical protein
MKTIHKYQLQLADEQPVEMPSGAEIISAHAQYNVPCIWAIVETDNPTVKRSIAMCGTGCPVPVGNYRFVGTTVTCEGALIWHIFQRPE